MAITLLDQETQVRSSFPVATQYDDTVAPSEANFETNPTNLNDDLNNLRSMVSRLLDVQAGDWFDDVNTPSALETGSQRGVNDLNTDLHAVEKKRVLVDTFVHIDVTVTAAQNFEILLLGELPTETTAAIGAVTTLGTVAAFHAGTFGTHSLDEVAGDSAVEPLNMGTVVDSATHDPILSSGRQVYALFQVEENTDGLTMTGTTTKRAQLSFVRLNAAGTDMEACPVGDIAGLTIHYSTRTRKRLEDLTEQDFLKGANIDVGAGSSTVDRQNAYTNQGTTPVDVVTNSILDLEGAGLSWKIRDDLEADLFEIVEGSAGGTSQVNIAAGVDEFDIDAVVNNFANGVSMDTGSASPIDVGVTDGHVETSAGDLHLQAFAEMFLDDANQTGSTWAQTDGIKLSEDTGEWDAFETAFGEVSLLNAIVQAKNTTGRRKVASICTVAAAADADVSGPSNDNNLDTDLGDLSAGTFVDDYDIFLNGALQVNGANAAANKDVYPGTALANGQLKFEKKIKLGDVITVIDWVS